MPNEHLAALQKARDILTEERRHAASALATSERRGGNTKRSEFIEIQSSLDAIDRAIANEEKIERERNAARPLSPEEQYSVLRNAARLRQRE